MNPNSPREYNIPEWKSEGFSDAIAVEIRKRAGQQLSPYEQEISASLNHYQREIVSTSVDAFVPSVVAP